MRDCYRGEGLLRSELQEILNNLVLSTHARQRLEERRSGMVSLTMAIKYPLLAYFNTDGSINICPTEHKCYVIGKSRSGDGKYVLVTFKEDTHYTMSAKRELAKLGIDR